MSVIVEVTRSYSGQEGFRVKAGRRFSVATPFEDLTVITEARYNQLNKSGLVRVWNPKGDIPLAQTPRPKYEGQVKGARINPPVNPQRPGQGAKSRKPQEAKPSEPSPLANPAGGKTGQAGSASSSPADPASQKSTSSPRGNRKSRSSQSTTHTKSQDGPKPSTPATAVGGVRIKDARRSKD